MRTVALLCLALVGLSLRPTWAQDVAQPVEAAAPGELTEGENLILNPSFEQEMAAWQVATPGAGLSMTRDDTCSSEGDFSMRVTAATREQSITVILHQGAVQPAKRYRFGVKYATSNVDSDAEEAPAPAVWMIFSGAGGRVGELFWVGDYGAAEWTPLQGEITTPADAATVEIRLCIFQQAGTVWFDEASFVPLFQGDEQASFAADGNLLYNADVEQGALDQPHGWCAASPGIGIHGEWVKCGKVGRHVWSNEQAHSGERCLACEIQDTEKVPYIFWTQYVPLKPNTTYKFTGWLRADGDTKVNLQACAFAARELEREVFRSNYAGAGPWQAQGVTFTTPQWDGACRPAYMAIVGRGKGTFYADDLRLEEAGAELHGVDVVLRSDKPGNVFATVDEVSLSLSVTNKTPEDLAISGKYAVTTEGQPPQWKPLTGEMVLPGGHTEEFPLPRLVSKPGIYTLRVLLSCTDGRAVERKATFAVGG